MHNHITNDKRFNGSERYGLSRTNSSLGAVLRGKWAWGWLLASVRPKSWQQSSFSPGVSGSSGSSKLLCLIFFFLLCDSIKSSWNISVVKFLLEKLKQELMTSPHNYTDKELKGRGSAFPLHMLSACPFCSPALSGREEAWGWLRWY